MTTEKIKITEVPADFASDVLREYWTSREPLPVMRGLDVPVYYLRRGIETVTALPASNAITIFTISVALYLLSGFMLTLHNLSQVLHSLGSSLAVTAYIKEGVEESRINEMIRELQANPKIRSVDYVSKDRALESFRRELGSRGRFLDGLDEDNPLPVSIDVVLHPDELGGNTVQKLVDALRSRDIVDEVVFGSEWVNRFQSIMRLFRYVGSFALVIMIGVTIFLIANTIKLVIYARRDEIGIMKLVGASDTFVKTPFVVGGVLQGALGALLGLLFLKLSFLIINSDGAAGTFLGIVIPRFEFLGPVIIVGVLVFGVLVGALGSLLAVGRFLDV